MLFRSPVGPVQLPEGIPGIDEEHRILPGRLRFRTIEEPECAGQGNGVEEVRADADHYIDCTGLDQLLPDLHFGSPGICCRVCHDETGPAMIVQRMIELLDPEIVCVVGRWHTEREPLVLADPLLVYAGYIERRIGHHKIKSANALMRVLVVGIVIPDITGQAMHREVHLAEPDRLGYPLHTVHRDLR